MKTKPLRAALYARVSTTDQGCSQQLHDLREYAATRGWPVEAEYVDNGHSGAKDTRPALNRLMATARARKIDAILTWKIDRWGRSMPHFVACVQELRSLGVRFIAITQGIDTDESNPASKLMLNLLIAFSEFERELIVERTRAGLARARREGRIGGRPRLVLDCDRALRLDEDGHTQQEIAEALSVSQASVSRILRARRPVPGPGLG
jgi:putative DNA-invertase from lambdoid prophage Rac